ncbi:serine hydrolase domain-containing protein [Actinoplanes utahensis]|uniref:Beta-lactamase n=1 Tax=Actinoplanes utahensis TaxID=1869 RepID=A0A0A6UIX7_ACTUT|nr:serine hydrolase domain-containing protein [Actinoplanes utahensis]KHD74264.1 beta-lactamase [Actinoplanes utahensis]GIF35486.1 serine hydrolase [Actinoplanes utahensis]
MLIRTLTAVLLAVPAAPPVTGPTPSIIDAVVQSYREETGVPSVAVAVTHGSRVVHVAGYGRTAHGEAVTDRTVMAVASVSKSMTALAVLQLTVSHGVRLDTAVRTYLPEFTLADDRAGRITVRQLLDHTSGLTDRTNPSFSRPPVPDLRAAVAAMRTARLATDPGTAVEYHNPNFQIAARLVEVVSGRPFGDYLRDHVFAPLGMTDSRTLDTADQLPASSRGHIMIAGVPVALPEPPAFGAGSGAVVSTAHDMASWLIAQAGQGRGPDGRQVVPAAAVAEMHRPSAGGYGLGWQAGTTPSGAPLVDHDGDMMTFTAYQAVLPASGYGVAVMAGTGTLHRDAQTIGAHIIDVIEGRTPPHATTPLVPVDLVLIGLALAVALLGVRGVRRARRPTRRSTVTLLLWLVPLIMLVRFHRIVTALYRGRDISWLQTVYLYPTFTLLLTVTSLTGLAIIVRRMALLARPAPESIKRPGLEESQAPK